VVVVGLLVVVVVVGFGFGFVVVVDAGCVVVVVDVVVADVVEVVVGPGPAMISPIDVCRNVDEPLISELRGRPSASSSAVTTPIEITKTRPTAAMIDQRRRVGATSEARLSASGTLAIPARASASRAGSASRPVGMSGVWPDSGGATALTICRTFSWPRSSEWKTSAEPIVAAALPTATPTMVPAAPSDERASAARIAPTTEAMTCLTLRRTQIPTNP